MLGIEPPQYFNPLYAYDRSNFYWRSVTLKCVSMSPEMWMYHLLETDARALSARGRNGAPHSTASAVAARFLTIAFAIAAANARRIAHEGGHQLARELEVQSLRYSPHRRRRCRRRFRHRPHCLHCRRR